LLAAAAATPGFLPEDEAAALLAAGERAARSGLGPLLEIGAYLGRSTLFLAAACAAMPPARRAVVFSVDHHRGSEEMQAGWAHHDPTTVDPSTGRMDTLPRFRRALERAGAEDLVIAVVGDSPTVAAWWSTPAALVLLDGGHGEEIARADYRAWSAQVAAGGLLAIHDVFPDPAEGGRPPYECFLEAVSSGRFLDEPALGRGSLKVLRRR
ncbi:MAG TPA: class I SAM-dependent methyltransferase, partial [Acidimicrobiales bacterium]|nr:class I SAM-dependent methyltransferase [Acidimicrobiales bacterium]